MRPTRFINTPAYAFVLLIAFGSQNAQADEPVTPVETRAIAKEAYIYANPMVDSYRVIHGYFLDSGNPEFKAPLNEINNIPRVYTHEDKAVQTPNSDTPYSWLGLDLRAEPIVLTAPEIEKDRYFSIQLIDLYTHNFAYIGSRTTGNDGGSFLLAGPAWKGDVPEGITKVFRSETELMLAVYRTQLFNPEDLEKVKAIQASYKVEPLSTFLSKPAPEAVPAIDFIEPFSQKELRGVAQGLRATQFRAAVLSDPPLREGTDETLRQARYRRRKRLRLGLLFPRDPESHRRGHQGRLGRIRRAKEKG